MIRRTAIAALTVSALLLSGGAAVAYTHSSSRPAGAHKTSGLTALRKAMGRYRNLQRAENAGYELFTDAKGVACIAMPGMGGMGVHFVKGSLVGDPAEHVRQPEALVYRINKDGMLTLAAAEYVVLKKAWDASHSSPPTLFGQVFMTTPAGNRYGLPAFYSLHAWAWYHNPAGNFAMWNPRVKC